MRHTTWRIAPFLLLAFLFFLATGSAQDAQPHDPTEQQPLAAEDEKTEEAYTQAQSEQADTIREATALLRKVKPATVSKLVRYTSKPKGFLGSSVYYAKEAFVLLFMNSPKQTALLTTSTTQSQPLKLDKPLARAVKLLEEAASHSNPDALYLLATLNFHGNFSHPISYDRAFEYYAALADLNGNSSAQHALAFLYATGLAPTHPADQAQSLLYHTFAAAQNHTQSQMTLAYRHHAGIGVPRDCETAVAYYAQVAAKAVAYYRSGPPGGHSLIRDSYRLADEDGGVYGEGASVSSSGMNAKQGGPTSDAYADVDDVLEYLHLQSSKGDLKATFGLARLHYDGARALKRDFRLAKQHFMIVAREYWTESGKIRKGEIPAGTEKLASKAAGYLGRLFLRGEGTEQSFAKAKIWFTRGLANGDALSQYSLGLMHLHGLGIPRDVAKAADLLAAAADQDLAVAQTSLGILFLDQGDTTIAGKYFELAARNGHIEAFYYLAEMSRHGIGREQNCGLAASYYKIVAEKAESVWAPALGEANDAFDDGDMSKAVVGYMVAAEQGSENAQANVAFLLDHTVPRWSPVSYLLHAGRDVTTAAQDAALALVYWTRSGRQHNIDSLVKMGDAYLAGLGAVASAEHAASCYQAAAETLQSAQAMWNLGWMHENGIGLPQDFHLAKRFYDNALETNPREAYLPVKMSLWMLGWRSWWNDVSGGGVKSMGAETAKPVRRGFWQWVHDFLEADAQMYAAEMEGQEADDWGSGEGMPGGDDDSYWGGEEIDDGVLETLLIGGLLAGLGYLIYYRQQRVRAAAAEAERRQREGLLQQGEEGGAMQQQEQIAPGQQADGGFFPQPGDPGWGDWVAGGVGH